MSVLGRLALLFVVIPLLELFILVKIGEVVGLLPTLALVLVTGAAGAALARREGMRVLWSVQSELGQGRVPGQQLLDGLSVLVGGAFLVTPGILTDLAGLMLLFPPTRRVAQRVVRRWFARRIREGSVNFVFMGPLSGGPWGGGPDAGGPFPGEPKESPRRGDGLDPSKEIRVERPDR